MNRYPHVAALVFNRPWAIHPDTFAVLTVVVRARVCGERMSDDEIQARIGDAKSTRVAPAKGKITVLPLHGVMGYRMGGFEDMSGGTSTERFAQWFDDAVSDPAVGAVVLDVDSPGGTVDGLRELSNKVRSARETKPIYAVANAMAASAGYYIASAAEQLWITPSGTAGSIGCIAEHWDYSKALEAEGMAPTLISSVPFKSEGHPYAPLGDEAREEFQRIVDEYGAQFEADVAHNRGVSKAKVKSDFGQGRMFMAQEAVNAGLADKVGTLAELLSKLGASGRDTGVLRKAAHARERKMRAAG